MNKFEFGDLVKSKSDQDMCVEEEGQNLFVVQDAGREVVRIAGRRYSYLIHSDLLEHVKKVGI